MIDKFDEENINDKEFHAPIEIPTAMGNFRAIKGANGGFEIDSIGMVNFSPEDLIEFTIESEKRPRVIKPGTTIDRMINDVENYGEKMQTMVAGAHEIGKLPEEERPSKLLELILNNMTYAYKDRLADLNDEQRAWIEENVLADSRLKEAINLSDVAESGFGLCRHLSFLAIVLAQEAGLEGNYYGGMTTFTNLPRKESDYQATDNRPALFRSFNEGRSVEATHAWIEVKVMTKTGETKWVPIDPATQLVGDTKERLRTFLDAGGYTLPSKISIDAKVQVGSKTIQADVEGKVFPGESKILSKLVVTNEQHVILGRPMKIIEPELYRGPLSISLTPNDYRDTIKMNLIAVK